MVDGILAGMLVIVLAFWLHGAKLAMDGRRVKARVKQGRRHEIPNVGELLTRYKPVSKQAYERQLPAVLDSIALSLYSGSGFAQAVREASTGKGPVADDMKRIVHETDMGESLADSLQSWGARVRYESVRLCAASMVMAIESGGNYVTAVDAASAAVRRSLEAAATAKTNATQSRASATALVVMPLVVTIPLLVFSHGAQAFTFHTFWGLVCLFGGVALDVLGWFWMQALVKRTLA